MDTGFIRNMRKHTGYRYYHEEQLFIIGRITALKDMGFALADIVKILEIYDDKEKLDVFLSERKEEYKEENVEVMVWMTVKGTYQDTEHVKFKTLPAVNNSDGELCFGL